jgi:hypothetical protein
VETGAELLFSFGRGARFPWTFDLHRASGTAWPEAETGQELVETIVIDHIEMPSEN